MTSPFAHTLSELAQLAIKQNVKVATAESCTGGWIAKSITDLAGSSQWFDCGFVTYSNHAKQRMLGVNASVLKEHGAVSEPVAISMVSGAIEHSLADMAVAVTGIAGPGGGTEKKPVGTVWVAWARKSAQVQTKLLNLQGDRDAIREQTVAFSLKKLLELVKA